ncbi:MAG: bifunctional (p)ppGpp synthetase/guanosine-3',5'-bis(diphosphate) 3'-pyrophosphohydrolase [Pseudomonadota bacterium]
MVTITRPDDSNGPGTASRSRVVAWTAEVLADAEQTLTTDGFLDDLRERCARADAVSEIVGQLGVAEEIELATMIRPLREAGLCSNAGIEEQFGTSVAQMVGELERAGRFVLPPEWSPGQALGADQAESLRKMLLAIVDDVRLVLVLLAEQLHRLRCLKGAPADEQVRCATETREIYAPLASRLGIWQFKWEMDDLSFRYLEPDTYKQIARWLRERRADREEYISNVVEVLGGRLEEAGIDCQIAGRPKHIYSIWNKMLRKGLDFEHIFDVRAVRVLVSSQTECYATLGIVHGMWRYLPGEFDDYIAAPKENNYQSLHTAVIGPEGKTLEVQIRTHEMHRHAELGVAAHWRYKEGGDDDSAYRNKISWLRRLLDPDEDDPDLDFLDRVRTEILDERVYVLTPRGDVVDLPSEATPLDFAYHVHTELGHRCRGARVNGRQVSLNHKLASGDQVEIVTAKEASPSRDWLIPQLGFLASTRARAKVRLWFRREAGEGNVEQGQSMVERELQRLGCEMSLVSAVVRHLRLDSANSLYAAVGAGDITLADIDVAVQKLTSPQVEPQLLPVARRRPRRMPQRSAIEVGGVDDLLHNFAQCCKPLPPDPILGFISQGRGISVHRADCPNLRKLMETQPERVVDVDWHADASHTFTADIRIEAADRRGLLQELSGAFASANVNITATQTVTDRTTGSAVFNLTVEITGLSELSRVLHRLSSVRGVHDVRRVR